MLREQSVRDFLTGLFNRRYMEETLARELSRESRVKRSLGIIMLDLDNLKYFNDLYGHGAGDAILREMGNLLIKQVSSEDIPSRIGGDEFIVVLPDTTKKVTQKRAELFREHVRGFQIKFEGKVLERISISGGVSAFPEDGSNCTAILKRADQALYRAKRDRRDRITVANA